MIDDGFSESAKAVQEVAKTTKAGIEATEKLGGFVSRIIGEPVDEVVGILKDKLKFMRWERQLRLTQRAKEIIAGKNIEGELRIVPPKVALPIIENASLEENDELQDLWAHLIASAVDPNFNGTIRAAFVDIIKQLEVNDVHILNYIYEEYSKINSRYKPHTKIYTDSKAEIRYIDAGEHPVLMGYIMGKFDIDENSYKESIDNLFRVRCVAPFIEKEAVKIPRQTSSAFGTRFDTRRVKFNVTHTYEQVCITSLGISFARACMNPKIENA